jgi:hypothetical protein
MNGTGDHHLKRNQTGSEGQKSHALPYMWIIVTWIIHLGENMHGRNREREGNLKLKCGECAHCRGANIVLLNWQRPLWKGN